MFRKAMALTLAAGAIGAGSAQAATTPTAGQQHEQTEHALGVPVPANATRPGPSAGLLHEQTERSLGVPAPGTGIVVAKTQSSTSRNAGFSWADALVGAAMAAGIFLLGGAGAVTLRRRSLARR
jgi:hypothetical protein